MDGSYGHSNSILRKPVSFVNFGMHSRDNKKFTIKPGLDDHGVYFFREGVATNDHIIDTGLGDLSDFTLSKNASCQHGVSGATIASLKLALNSSQVKYVKIDMRSSQVSVANGSSGPFAKTVRGTISQYLELSEPGGWMKQPIAVRYGEECSLLLPHPLPKISITIEGLGTVVFLRCSNENLTA
ncbi:MAG: UDP-3-O-acyl-N-acetylglucosamine deacetylase [Thiohalomonadales bacterium]